MAITRAENWAEERLHKFLNDRANMSFEWGKNDCALFAADGIEAMTGVDIASEFRGKYDDEASAARAIADVCGGATVEDAAAWCASRHGLPEWRYPLMAQRGDLVIVQDAGRPIAGLIHLSGRHVVCPGDQGLKRLPIAAITRAWHVGPHLGSRVHEVQVV